QNPNRPHRRTLLQLRPTLAGGRQHATQIALVFQRQPDRLHLFRFAVGEIGQRSMLDLAIFAIRLAQKVAGVGLAVEAGDRAVDEHYGYICKPNSRSLQEKCATISGYISNTQIAPNLLISIHKLSMSERRKGEHPIQVRERPMRELGTAFQNLMPERRHLVSDLIAGLTFAVVNVPQAMGHALLATVNPVLGIYTLIVAAPVAALSTSSVFMNVSTTAALSVAAGADLAGVPDGERAEALAVLVLLVGGIQLASSWTRPDRPKDRDHL